MPKTRDASLPSIDCIRKRDLAKRLGVNPWTIDNWRRRGIIPQPIKITGNMVFWRVSDIDAWLREKEAAA